MMCVVYWVDLGVQVVAIALEEICVVVANFRDDRWLCISLICGNH